jgi:DNA-directed RNA polymerase specialized sigma24 family protein
VSASRIEWPALDSRYIDEYGPISVEVYEAARDIWASAEEFGAFALQDTAAAFDLMLKATAKVTARMSSGGPEIKNIQTYLYQTYKHLVGREKANRLKYEQPLDESDEFLTVNIVPDLECKIMLRELFAKMNNEDRELANYLMFGYTYEEIAAEIGASSDALRKRFSRLKGKISAILAQK